MAVPLRLKNMPEHIRNSHFTEIPGFPTKFNEWNSEQEELQFPKSTCVLWDGTSTGLPVFLHVAHHRKPRFKLDEKLLWLIHRQCDAEGSANRVLVGSLSVDDDAMGVSFHIEGLDTRQTGSQASSNVALGDVMIPVQVSNSNKQDRIGSVEDYLNAMKTLKKRCCSREPVELSNLLLVKGWCGFYSGGNADKTVAHLQLDVVTLATVFKATPVNNVPIVPTALAKNLAGPRSLSQVQGKPKSGYLTMDHTRKLLLVLESDPKVSSLPIVGIWVSGVTLIHHPFVWASCLRYLHCDHLQDRVCMPPEGFLLVLYSPLHSKPEFYEVCTTSGSTILQYDLYTGYEITNFFKQSSGPDSSGCVHWEVCPVQNGPKRGLFDAAMEDMKSQGFVNINTTSSAAISFMPEDIVPRSTPAPHQAKAMEVKHLVPEVSLLWTENTHTGVFTQHPSSHFQSSAASHTSATPAFYPHVSASQSPPTTILSSFPSPHAVTVSASSHNHRLAFRSDIPVNLLTHNSVPVVAQHGAQVVGEHRAHSSSDRFNQQNTLVLDKNGFSQPCSGSSFQGNNVHTMNPHLFSYQPFPSLNATQYTSAGNLVPQNCFTLANSVTQKESQPHLMPPPSAMQNSSQPCLMPPISIMQNSSQPRLMPPISVNFCRPPSLVDFNLKHQVPSAAYYSGPSTTSQTPSELTPGDISKGNQPNHQFLFGKQQHLALSSQDKSSRQTVQSVNLGSQYPQTVTVLSQTPSVGQQQTVAQQSNTSSALQITSSHFPLTDNEHLHNLEMKQAQVLRNSPHLTAPQTCKFITSTQVAPSVSTVSVPNSAQFVQSAVRQHQGVGLVIADSTSCSGKSSDDSGLNVTPDRSNPSPKPTLSPQTADKRNFSFGDGGDVSWDQVHPQVLQLLAQQDAQLKLLQAQIQVLLAQQQQTTQYPASFAATSTAPATMAAASDCTPSLPRKPVETCSVAVNTTIVCPEPPSLTSRHAQCVSVQTSPLKSMAAPFLTSAIDDGPSVFQDKVQNSPGWEIHNSTRRSVHLTPEEIHHQGVVPLNSTLQEGGTRLGEESCHSHGGQNRLWDSVEQTSAASSSPQSASMCVCASLNEKSAGEDITPNSEYYDQLVTNIQLFLNNHCKDTNVSCLESKKIENPTLEETQVLLNQTDLTSPGSSRPASCPSIEGSSNASLMPCNYLPMLMDSESDVSLEINAMAMKYLRDEQLTQIARLRQLSSGSNCTDLLRRVLASASISTPDVSQLGVTPNMSMATRKYMEKHGLLNVGQCNESELDCNYTIHLKTDFSLAVMSEKSLMATSHNQVPSPTTGRSPVKKELIQRLSSPASVTESPFNTSGHEGRWKGDADLGASPLLRPASRQPHNYARHISDQSLDESPIFPERYQGIHTRDIRSNEYLSVTDGDRILDIEKLRQMPKLL